MIRRQCQATTATRSMMTVAMKRKRRNSNSNITRQQGRQAIRHILAILVALIGAANVVQKLAGAANLLMKSNNTTTIPSKRDWIQKSRVVMHLDGNKQGALLVDSTIHNNKTRAQHHHVKLIMTPHQSRHHDIQETPKFDWKSQSDSECRTVHEWQRPSNGPYSCNLLHEMMDEMQHLHLIDCGGDRCAYRVHHHDHDIVLKVPKLSLDLRDPNVYASAWMDTISMERLSASPYALDIYGNCAISQLTQLAEHSLFAHILHERRQLLLAGNTTTSRMTPEEQLSIAHHVASGIADMHHAGIAHNDLSIHQFLFVEGIYKISDFDLASFVKTNKEGLLPCREQPQTTNRHFDKARAPEELLYRQTRQKIHRRQSDVWALGNCLYQIFTKGRDFENMTTVEAREFLLNGNRSVFPSEYLTSSTNAAANTAMIVGTSMAWMPLPETRPTAQQIANYLSDQLLKLSYNSEPPWKLASSCAQIRIRNCVSRFHQLE